MNPEIKDFFSHETMFTNSKNIENYPVLCNVKGFMVKLFANMGSIKKNNQKYSYLETQLQSFLNHLPRQGLVLGPGEERELFYTFLEKG